MKKEFVFSARFDTSEFDKTIEQMQQKMKSAYSQFDVSKMQRDTGQRMQQAGMGGMSMPSMDAFMKATQQSRREMDQLITEQARGQERIGKIIAARNEELKKMRDAQRQMVKDSKEELEIKEKIARVEANNQRLRESYRQSDQLINQAMDAREKMKPQGVERLVNAYRGGGVGGVGTALGRMYGGGALAGTIGSVMGGIGAIGERAASIYGDFGRAAPRTEGAMGSAVQGTVGGQVGNIYGRRSSFEQFFAEERSRAARQALDTLGTTQTADKAGLGFGMMKNIGGGIGMGATIGAGIGSFGGPFGTAGGALIGGALGLGKGVWDVMGDERQRSLALSPFSSTASKRYQSMLAEELANNYSQSYEGQKKQNPFKFAAGQEYEQNWNRNLQAQRGMGLGNGGFYGGGGFMQNNINAGFTGEMGLEMSGSILGAGGSTRMARESAFGNQMSRGLDLTNAGNVLGTLSGGLGSSESTKQATIKILAEGMKLGLDDSKFAEENRKFVQSAAEIVSKSGARGESDFERVIGGFGKFVGENTTSGLGAAKTAYEQYQSISQSTTGPRGTMRAAGFMADKDLRRISTMTKQALMQVPESDLNESNPVVQAAAQEAGISEKDLVSKVTNVNQGAVSRFSESDALRDKVRQYAKSIGKENLSQEDIDKAPKDIKDAFNKMVSFQTTELGYQGQREAVARGLGTVNVGAGGGAGALGRENIISDKLTRDTGRIEDATVKAMAADSKVVLENFNEMAPAMRRAAESTAAWTREVREANAALVQALENARLNKGSSSLDALRDIMTKQASPANQNQPQTGKQSK